MTIQIDPITRKKLIIVKQLYQNAMIQSASHHSNIDKVLSVIGFDLTIETLLRAIVGSLDSSKSPADGFQGLVQQCDSLLSGNGLNSIPDKANIQYIHSIRNDAQHKAKYPNESDTSDCRTYTRDFLQKTISGVWGIDFEKISLTDVVQHEKVRQFLVDAESHLSQGDYQKAIQSASAGLTYTLNHVESAIVGRLPSFANAIVLIDKFGEPMSDRDSRNGFHALERMQDALLYVVLGMSYTEYMRYKKFTGYVSFNGAGEPFYAGKVESAGSNDAEFVVAYSINTVVQIEGIVGSIDSPFGSEHYLY